MQLMFLLKGEIQTQIHTGRATYTGKAKIKVMVYKPRKAKDCQQNKTEEEKWKRLKKETVHRRNQRRQPSALRLLASRTRSQDLSVFKKAGTLWYFVIAVLAN